MLRLVLLALLLGLAACARPAPPSASGPVPEEAPPVVAFVDVHVVPMDRDRVLPSQTVVVRGDRIAAMGPVATTPVPDGATVIPGEGRYLMPGLWDLHTHLGGDPEGAFLQDLAFGVTGVRDLGSFPDTLAAVRRRGAATSEPRPRLVAAGPLLDGPAFQWSPAVAWHLTTPADVGPALDSLQALGVDFLKVYSTLPPDAFRALAAEADRRGLSFGGHLSRGMTVLEVAAAGMASLEHAGVDVTTIACLPDGENRFLNLFGLWAEGGYAAYVNGQTRLAAEADPACLDQFAADLAGHGTRFVPTLVQELKRIENVDEPSAGRPVPEGVRALCAGMLDGFGPVPDSVQAAHRRRLLGDVARFHAAGVPLLAGSDAPNPCAARGAGVHAEIALFVEAGLTPFEALETATTGAWRFFRDSGIADEHGTVAPGEPADLLLLAANPLADIRATRAIQGVLVAGQWLPRARLDEMLRAASRS